MNCPVDGTQLLMSDRQGIEVDYCPQCRGIWLDRGELDKLIERSAQAPVRDERQQFREERPSREATYEREPERKRKRGSFLEDIFDFGGE
jgi:Zn-finger nucleic acid-binding protein